jgi:DNA-binding transcriptional LysR family regulator
MRHRLNEPIGTVHCTAAMATMQFAMRDSWRSFLAATPRSMASRMRATGIDIVGENYDVAVRAHTEPLPDLTLVQRKLAPAPWLLFAGAAHLDANDAPQTPADLRNHPSLFHDAHRGGSGLAASPCERMGASRPAYPRAHPYRPDPRGGANQLRHDMHSRHRGAAAPVGGRQTLARAAIEHMTALSCSTAMRAR